MDLELKIIVDKALSERVFNLEESLVGFKPKDNPIGICDCDEDDDDGGCSN